MSSNNFAKTASSSTACFNSRLNSADVATNHDAYQTGTDLLGADEGNVSSLNHCISCFDSSYETSGLNHTKCEFHNC